MVYGQRPGEKRPCALHTLYTGGPAHSILYTRECPPSPFQIPRRIALPPLLMPQGIAPLAFRHHTGLHYFHFRGKECSSSHPARVMRCPNYVPRLRRRVGAGRGPVRGGDQLCPPPPTHRRPALAAHSPMPSRVSSGGFSCNGRGRAADLCHARRGAQASRSTTSGSRPPRAARTSRTPCHAIHSREPTEDGWCR